MSLPTLPLPGDPAPWFTVPTTTNPRWVFSSAAGRWLLLAFLGGADRPGSRAVLELLARLRARFDVDRLAFLGVSVDPADRIGGRLRDDLPAIRFLWDEDGAVSRLWGVLVERAGEPVYRPAWFLVDPQLRIAATVPFDAEAGHLATIERLIEELPEPDLHAGVPVHAPILILPRVFERRLCRALIAHYEERGGSESGFMVEREGRTVLVTDPGHKRRADCEIVDPALRSAAQERIRRRVVPEIARAFQFHATRIERHIVACYDAESGGHFRPHRDNTTPATAHRRFAVSVNLDAEAYEGGDLVFPEFGSRTYRAPTGGAVVFSCSLLHEVRPVLRGRRYAYLPFLYDEAAARIRAANAATLGPATASPPAPEAPSAT